MAYFITNSKNNDLLKRIEELVKNSKELKFLTAFFYFSGTDRLYKSLKENNDTILKVLVGLKVDYHNFRLIETTYDTNPSNEEITDEFIKSVCTSLRSEKFDSKEVYEQAGYFLSLLENNRLIIRKTVEPNHSKLYLFYLKDEQIGRNKLFITGSSNLTAAGLTSQNEFNVEISDFGFDEAERYFDELWNNSVEITEYEETRRRLLDTIREDTFLKEITPFEAYCIVLHNYINSIKSDENTETIEEILNNAGYKPYRYQVDAIAQAYKIIQDYNGVLIADVVGLGKTVIACALARRLKERGIVICPPPLIGDETSDSGWKKYVDNFRLFDWKVFSRGNLTEPLKFVRDPKRKDIKVVIVDEAHRFRNDDTESYEQLKNIVRGKKVILLTATPFNNHPYDILNLLRLFLNPKKSPITLGSNLYLRFMQYENKLRKISFILKNYNSPNKEKRDKAISYNEGLYGTKTIEKKRLADSTRYISKSIRSIIEPVTIRRNRIDLEKIPEYASEVGNLSKVADPQTNEDKTDWYFELEKKQLDFYSRVIEKYFASFEDGGKFYGAIYRPFDYEKRRTGDDDSREFQQQRNLYGFMQRLLVKRFESSFGAFKKSLENFRNVTVICRDFIKQRRKFILDRKLVEKMNSMSDEEMEETLLEYSKSLKDGSIIGPKSNKIYKIDEFELRDKFENHIESDIKLFERVLSELDSLKLTDNDPKADCLIRKLKALMQANPQKGEPEPKFVIFSEYADTVKHLQEKLEKEFGKEKVLTIYGSLSESEMNEINKNFDASYKEQEDRYRILLTTDKLSEGVNLNRAQYVINYDIPWNPVRVIQRLGRINRISKKVFEKLYIVNFFPTQKGADIVQSKTIAQQKMFIIHNTLGEDAKIFDIDEEPEPSKLFDRLRGDPERIEGENIYTKIYLEYLRLKKENPEIFEKITKYPPRIKVAKSSDKNEMIVFFKKKRMFAAAINTEIENAVPDEILVEEAIERIKCNKDEKGLEWNTDRFWQSYEKIIQNKYQTHNGIEKENTLEIKAFNKIKTLLKNKDFDDFKYFLRMLKEDIVGFGTLPDYTLRKIEEINSKEDIISLIEDLGRDYLKYEKIKHEDKARDVIIAIENIKVNN